MNKNFVGLFLILLICSGCFPFKLQQTPHIAGIVSDNDSKQPIANAKVYFKEYPKQFITTSTNGSFDFPSIFKREFEIIGPVDRNGTRHLTIEASDYWTTNLIFGLWRGDTNEIIYLKRK